MTTNTTTARITSKHGLVISFSSTLDERIVRVSTSNNSQSASVTCRSEREAKELMAECRLHGLSVDYYGRGMFAVM